MRRNNKIDLYEIRRFRLIFPLFYRRCFDCGDEVRFEFMYFAVKKFPNLIRLSDGEFLSDRVNIGLCMKCCNGDRTIAKNNMKYFITTDIKNSIKEYNGDKKNLTPKQLVNILNHGK